MQHILAPTLGACARTARASQSPPTLPAPVLLLRSTLGLALDAENVWAGNDLFDTWARPIAPVAVVDGATTGPTGALDAASFTPPAGNAGPPGLAEASFTGVVPFVPVVVECSYKAGVVSPAYSILAPDLGGGVVILDINAGAVLTASHVGSVVAQGGGWHRTRLVYPPAGSDVTLATLLVEAVGENGPDWTYGGLTTGYLWHATARQVQPITSWTDTLNSLPFAPHAPTGGAPSASSEFPWPVAAGSKEPVRVPPTVALTGALAAPHTGDELTIALAVRYDDWPGSIDQRWLNLPETGEPDDTNGNGGVCIGVETDGSIHVRRGATVLTSTARPGSAGTIQRWVVVFDGAECRVYIDGVQAQGVPSSGPFALSAVLLSAARTGGVVVPSAWWTTLFAVHVYTSALDAAQVAAIDAALAIASL